MPHFCGNCGRDEYICQHCGKIFCSFEDPSHWIHNPQRKPHGNLCPKCYDELVRKVIEFVLPMM